MRYVLAPLTLLAAAIAAPLPAATVVIWPVDPVIAAGQQGTALWLENKGAEPVTMQVRSFAWSQDNDGAERLETQDQVVASPPIATVAPGRRQLVRIVRRVAPVVGAPAESAYRLVIDELPAAPEGTGAGLSARLAVQMRYSIPLFAYTGGGGGAAPQPDLVATIKPTGAGRVLEIRNRGTLHARLSDLRMGEGSAASMMRPGLAGYVLPGARLRFDMPQGAAGAIRVGVNGQERVLAPEA